MKTQVLSREIASLSIIGFLLLVIITSLGCGILSILSNAYPVMRLDPVLLTQDDLPTMRLTKHEPISRPTEASSLIAESQQSWIWNEGRLAVYYYLLRSTPDAKRPVFPLFPAKAVFRPEPNPKEVIGDATWRVRTTLVTYIFFVKDNVEVHIMMGGRSSNRLQSVREVARKIEAKIAAVSEKK